MLDQSYDVFHYRKKGTMTDSETSLFGQKQFEEGIYGVLQPLAVQLTDKIVSIRGHQEHLESHLLRVAAELEQIENLCSKDEESRKYTAKMNSLRKRLRAATGNLNTILHRVEKVHKSVESAKQKRRHKDELISSHLSEMSEHIENVVSPIREKLAREEAAEEAGADAGADSITSGPSSGVENPASGQ